MVDDVQTDVVPDGTPSPEAATPEVEAPPQPQPLTEERLQQILAEERESTRRQLQSEKDKAIAEVRREAEGRVRSAESRAQAIKSSLRGFDPETQSIEQVTELAELRSQVSSHQTREQEEQARRGFYEVVDNFEANMTQHITDLGIDPQKIDWGDRDSSNLMDRQRVILSSVSKIQKENAKVAEDRQKQEFKDLESKLRKDLGLDNVDTSTAGAGGEDSDEAFEEKMADRDHVTTAEDLKRIDKILGK